MFPLNAQSFGELFTYGHVLIYLGMAVLIAVCMYFSSMKFLLVLQQSGYRGKRYFKWVKNPQTPYLSRLMLLCLLAFLFFCVLSVTFKPIVDNTATSYIGFLAYLLFFGIYINTERSVNVKVPLKKTKRLVRLAVVYLLVLTAVIFGVIVLLNYLAFVIGSEIVAVLRYSLLCAMPIFTQSVSEKDKYSIK